MPTPVGHGLAALAAGWAIAGPASRRPALVTQAAIFVAVGVAPDLDLLIDRHSAETHSLGAAAIVASVAAWWRWPVAAERWRIWLAIFLAWMTHPLLDGLSSDTSAPYGIMALWPFSNEYMRLPWPLFAAITRRWWLEGFWMQNLKAVTRELVILLPILGFVWWARRLKRSERSLRKTS